MKTFVTSRSVNPHLDLQKSSARLWRHLYANLPLSPPATLPSAQLNISTENQYYIQDGDSKRLCVIKSHTKSSDLELFGRVKAELKTLKRIIEHNGNSPEIQFTQNLLVGFHSDLHVFVVLDYYPDSLADLLLTSHIGFQSSAVLLAAELVLALNFLHSRSILHQDLKPANVMISPYGHIVIGGFGSSCVQDASGNMQVKLRRQDTVTFTPRYAAPEINFPDGEGNLAYDERVDWWSLGVVLYELVADDRPFSPPPTIQTRVADLPINPTIIRLEEFAVTGSTVDPQLMDFICSLLQNDPSCRLSGSIVKSHAFFDIIAEIWEDVAALRYPPFTLAMSDDRGTHSFEESNMRESYDREDSEQLPNTTETFRYEHPFWSSSGNAEESQKSPSGYTSTSRCGTKPVSDHTGTNLYTLDSPRRRRHTITGSSTHQSVPECYCLPTSRSMPVSKLGLEELLTVSLLRAMDSRDSTNHRAHKVPRTRENRNISIAGRVWQKISKPSP